MNEKELIRKYVPLKKQKEAFEKLDKNYPVQYIIGNVDFYDCEIDVTPSVLIPRFETELLVDKTIKYIKNIFANEKVTVADLGTGSGAIAIALEKNLNAEVDAYDICKKALAVAKKNAIKNNADINFINHDIRKKLNKKYNIIISNPPYVKEGEAVANPVLYEPKKALYAKNEGLEFYEKILSYAKEVLLPKFLIAFEIGETQGQEIINIAKAYFSQEKIILEKDLNSKDRYIFIINE